MTTEIKAYITIPLEDYDELVRRDHFLSALEEAGVDNWSGWEFAWDIFETQYGSEDDGEES